MTKNKEIGPMLCVAVLIFAPRMAVAHSGVRDEDGGSRGFSSGPSGPQEQASSPKGYGFSNTLSVGIAVPLNGTVGVMWGRPISERVELSSFVAFFERDWMVLLDKGDWHSNTVYIGTGVKWYAGSEPGSFCGYFVGGDTGIASSYQTYRPLDESEVFFFPWIELYFFGWTQPIWRGFTLELLLGGGYSPVSQVVTIKGHTNEGDFYPLGDLRVSYRW